MVSRTVDIVDEVEEEVQRIKDKIAELDALHKKHLLPGFDDQLGAEQSIDRLTDQITQVSVLFNELARKESAEKHSPDVPRFRTENKASTFGESGIIKHLPAESSTKSKHPKLRGRETQKKDVFMLEGGSSESAEDEALDAVFTDAQLQQVQNNERAITQREKEINEIVKSLLGLAEIFKEIQTMVIDQGTVLDRIDYNIEQTNVHMEAGHKELLTAAKIQDRTKAKLCIILLSIVVFLLFIILIFKPKKK
ncbi:hypothetical protein HK104_002625 [Borealophlyctis nickersoniae]|nr:hypothetical protein HK104_002625 [Borealophlyctis nickersoniae]